MQNEWNIMLNKNYKYGFTLAEVLITLVIIGVIAALTVPSLIQRTEKQEYVARLKKAQSVLQNAIYKIGIDQGYPPGDYSFVTSTNDFLDGFEKVVHKARRCKGTNDCMIVRFKCLNNRETSLHHPENSFVTPDGITYTYNYDYSSAQFGLKPEDRDKYLGRFRVDINGMGKPQQILPAGYGNDSADCNRSGDGFTCAAKVLKEDAINY